MSVINGVSDMLKLLIPDDKISMTRVSEGDCIAYDIFGCNGYMYKCRAKDSSLKPSSFQTIFSSKKIDDTILPPRKHTSSFSNQIKNKRYNLCWYDKRDMDMNYNGSKWQQFHGYVSQVNK